MQDHSCKTKTVSKDDHTQHVPLEKFIFRVNLAKDLFSALEDGNIPELQNLALATHMQDLSDALSQTRTFYKGVEFRRWDIGLLDALWASQGTLVDLLQLPPREQHMDHQNNPIQQRMLLRVKRQVLMPLKAARIQAEIGDRIHAITAELKRVKLCVRGLDWSPLW